MRFCQWNICVLMPKITALETLLHNERKIGFLSVKACDFMLKFAAQVFSAINVAFGEELHVLKTQKYVLLIYKTPLHAFAIQNASIGEVCTGFRNAITYESSNAYVTGFKFSTIVFPSYNSS